MTDEFLERFQSIVQESNRHIVELREEFSALRAGLESQLAEVKVSQAQITERMNNQATLGRRLEETQKETSALISRLTVLETKEKQIDDLDLHEMSRTLERHETTIRVLKGSLVAVSLALGGAMVDIILGLIRGG